MNKMLCIRLSPEINKALESIATATERPKSFLVRKALETYLAEYADYQIALDRLQDKNDPIISSKEFWRSLED